MNMKLWSIVAILVLPVFAHADEPKPIPLTREEIKQALEALKKREARLPLPPLSEAEIASGGSVVNNGRMRAKYLAPDLRGASGGGSRDPDSAMTLDPTFKVYLFWITSRVNNCHYCLGHQEQKLAVAGVKDDTIAALDGDWSEFTPAEQAAFAFTRKLTFEPYAIDANDLAAIKKHYTPTQVLEIAFTVAGYNATNRWTDSLGIPAENNGNAFKRFGEPKRDVDLSTFLTPTSEAYRKRPSRVAPRRADSRPEMTATDIQQALNQARTRTALLPVVSEPVTRERVKMEFTGPVPQWVRLLATFPKQGVARIDSWILSHEKGVLPVKLKAMVSYTAAKSDRAWYALAIAQARLQKLGVDDLSNVKLTEAEKLALAFTRKLTESPQAITDADIASLKPHYPPEQIAELVYHITNAAFFDRITEVAKLPLEP